MEKLAQMHTAFYKIDTLNIIYVAPVVAILLTLSLWVGLGVGFWASFTIGMLSLGLCVGGALLLEEEQRKGREEAWADFRRKTGG